MLPAPSTPLDLVIRLYDFNSWARERIVTSARRVPEEDLRRPGVIAGGQGHGSVFDSIVHLASADALWTGRWTGNPKATAPRPDAYASLADLAGQWEQTQAHQVAWLRTLREEDLARPQTQFSGIRQVTETFPLWETLIQISNHATHHRSEVCVGLTALGSPPDSVDFFEYLRDGSPRS